MTNDEMEASSEMHHSNLSPSLSLEAAQSHTNRLEEEAEHLLVLGREEQNTMRAQLQVVDQKRQSALFFQKLAQVGGEKKRMKTLRMSSKKQQEQQEKDWQLIVPSLFLDDEDEGCVVLRSLLCQFELTRNNRSQDENR